MTYLQQPITTRGVDSMDTESSTEPRSNESIYEPVRFISASEPPAKRFYRTFWRSVTRRMIQLDKQSALHKAAMSSSDASDDGSSTHRASH